VTDVVSRTVAERLSTRLRAATRVEHERTESAPFIAALLDGRLDRDAYIALLGQSYLFYSTLEDAGRSWQHDEIVGPFVSAELVRCSALEADLACLSGVDWRDGLAPLPATRRYVERMREVCFTSRTAFVAHHYTRYLGDLSGGQIIRRKLAGIYGLTTDGVRFYIFDGIDKPKPFKDGYRRLLDEAPWDAAEQAGLVAEANEAFRLNRAVFDDLGQTLG
jgi:heme oxygenase